MDTPGAARLAQVLKTRPDPPPIGLDQTPRTFRMAVVTGGNPLTLMFNDDPLATVSGIPSLVLPSIGDMVVVGVFEGGGMCVLGTMRSGTQQPWWQPWGMIGGGYYNASLGSSGSSNPATVVFPPQTFTCVAKRLYKISWHAAWVVNTQPGASTVTVQFANGSGVAIQTAAVSTFTSGNGDEMSAFMYGQSDLLFAPGAAAVEMVASATGAAGFVFQAGAMGSYLLVEDMGPAASP